MGSSGARILLSIRSGNVFANAVTLLAFRQRTTRSADAFPEPTGRLRAIGSKRRPGAGMSPR